MAVYRGRFAPSPTGPLHFGSLVAALGSWLAARAAGGRWIVRMEDLDTPRNAPGAADEILRGLEAHGLVWDEPVVRQSERLHLYASAIDQLRRDGLVYPCACTRRELGDSIVAVDGAAIYPGTCRGGLPPGRAGRSSRVRAEGEIRVDDAVQGRIVQRLETEVGDFVLERADGIYAYQLAVVVDDDAQGIGSIVRGADLLLSTPRQAYLQSLLGLARPTYAHLPVALDRSGEKLSKQTRAPALASEHSIDNLLAALEFLGQTPPARADVGGVAELLAWAVARWDLAKVPRLRGKLHAPNR